MTGGRSRTGLAARVALLSILAGVAATTALLSCGGDGPTQPPGPERFFPLDFMSTYVQVRDCRLSIDHPASIRVFVNPAAATAYLDSIYPFAEGTVCIKALYSDDSCSVPSGYDAMRKGPPGTAPASNDWEWQSVNVAGAVTASGQIASCISCHTGCTNGRDYTCTDP